MMEDDRRNRSSRNNTNSVLILLAIILFLALVAAVLAAIVLACVATLRNNTAAVTGVEDDNPWFPCERRITMDFHGSHWTMNGQKPDGESCKDMCLNNTLPASCHHGSCTGTCAGESEFYFEFGVEDCPEIVLADIVDTVGLYRTSFSFFGKCVYMIFNLEEIPPNAIAGLFQVFLGSSEAERRMSDTARGLIGDSDGGKIGGCYDVSFFPTQLSHINTSIAVITFECARYMHEGVDDDQLTLSLTEPVPESYAKSLPSDFPVGGNVVDYVWSHRSEIEGKQIGVEGSFPKIQWKP